MGSLYKTKEKGQFMYLVQVWALPPLPEEFNLELPTTPPIRLKLMEAICKSGKKIPCTFVEIDGTQREMGDAIEKDFRHIGRFLSRLGFFLNAQFNVFSARLIPKGLSEGQKFKWIEFPKGINPPGISLVEHKVGYSKTWILHSSYLTQGLTDELEGAITWFQRGLVADNSIEQVLYHWIGLEKLAPILKGPWKCGNCAAEILECPQCHNSTSGERVLRSIREFITNHLGVSAQKVNELYKFRNKIVHGQMAMDSEGIEAAAKKGFRIQQLLFDCIKKEMGIPLDKPPLIEPRGIQIISVSGHFSGPQTGYSSDLYERPTWCPEEL